MKRIDPSEHEIQAAYFDWVRMMANQDDRYSLIFAVPNAAKRTKYTRGKMLAEGLTKGIPDVIGLVPNCTYHGFALEFKAPHGRCTKEQKAFIELLNSRKYAASVVRSLEDAVSFTKFYFRDAVFLVGRDLFGY